MKRVAACMGLILTAILYLSPFVFASPNIFPFQIQWDGAQLLWQQVPDVVSWEIEYELPETGETGTVAILPGDETSTELGVKWEGGRYVYVKIWGYDETGSIIASDRLGFYLSRHVDLTNSTLDRLKWMFQEIIGGLQQTIVSQVQQFQQFVTSTFIPTNSPAFQNLQDAAQGVIDKTPIGEITHEVTIIKTEVDDIWEKWENGLPSDAGEFNELLTFDYGEVYGMKLKFVFPVAAYVKDSRMEYVWRIAEAIILISFVFLVIRRLGVGIGV